MLFEASTIHAAWPTRLLDTINTASSARVVYAAKGESFLRSRPRCHQRFLRPSATSGVLRRSRPLEARPLQPTTHALLAVILSPLRSVARTTPEAASTLSSACAHTVRRMAATDRRRRRCIPGMSAVNMHCGLRHQLGCWQRSVCGDFRARYGLGASLGLVSSPSRGVHFTLQL